MKRPIDQSTRLQNFSALAASLLAFAGPADAQIIYTNITDYTGLAANNDMYKLDLNNSGSTDFTIKANVVVNSTYSYTNTINFVRVSPVGANNGVANNGGTPTALSLNSPINAGLNWVNNGSQIMGYASNYANGGNWPAAIDMYLPLKLVVSSNTYYGWARLDVAADASSFTIKDYAYESTPGKQILAGDKTFTTSVDASTRTNFEAFSTSKQIKINFDHASERQVRVINVMGQELCNLQVNGNQELINSETYPQGVYFVLVTEQGFSHSKKIYIW